MAYVSAATMAGFALVMFVVPAVVGLWIGYDAKKRGVLGPSIVWIVVAFFTTAVGALVSLYVYATRIRPAGE